MYLARHKIHSCVHYSIRESYHDGEVYKSRELFDLGSDPTRYIVYPGGHGYYYHESLMDALEKKGLAGDQNALDEIFWEFLDPEIRRVIDAFDRGRNRKHVPVKSATPWTPPGHPFDRRRLHFLRFGRICQNDLDRCPASMFQILQNKSRDEIEQYFLAQEKILKPSERATYCYVIFNLQRFFEDLGPTPRQRPWDVRHLDNYFISEICRLNVDDRFWAGMPSADRLRPYLVHYVIMFFDDTLKLRPALHDPINDFINRHRVYRPPKSVRIKMEKAANLFERTWKELKQMSADELTRLYRRQALKHHPDQGGTQEAFLALTTAYRALLTRKS